MNKGNNYEVLEIVIVRFDAEDLILTSNQTPVEEA